MKINKNILLRDYTTFKIGGPAKYFCVATDLKELKEAYLWAESKSLETFILGGGSNVLFSDDGFNGLIVKIENKGLVKLKETEEKVTLVCEAGVLLADLVKFSVENGLTGLEWAAGIPGTIGGAIRGNAGAFGFSISDSIKTVAVISKNNENFQSEIFEKEKCDFNYRASFFKKNKNLIIWSAEIELKKGEQKEIEKKFKEYIVKRKEKQPPLGKFPSIGSFFKNPQAPEVVIKIFEEEKGVQVKDEKIPAGWLIEKCGLKGRKIGEAMVSNIQANFIVNLGNASSEQIIILASLVKQKVRNNFGIQLEEEVEIVI